MLLASPKISHKLVFFWAMGYISVRYFQSTHFSSSLFLPLFFSLFLRLASPRILQASVLHHSPFLFDGTDDLGPVSSISSPLLVCLCLFFICLDAGISWSVTTRWEDCIIAYVFFFLHPSSSFFSRLFFSFLNHHFILFLFLPFLFCFFCLSPISPPSSSPMAYLAWYLT